MDYQRARLMIATSAAIMVAMSVSCSTEEPAATKGGTEEPAAKKSGAGSAPMSTKKKILLTSWDVSHSGPGYTHFEEEECILIKTTNKSPEEFKIMPIPKDPKLDCEAQAWQYKSHTAVQDGEGSLLYNIGDADFKVPQQGTHPQPTSHTLQMEVEGWVNGDPTGLPNQVKIKITDHSESGESHPGHGRYN